MFPQARYLQLLPWTFQTTAPVAVVCISAWRWLICEKKFLSRYTNRDYRRLKTHKLIPSDYMCIWSRCCSILSSWIKLNNRSSRSFPNTPPGILRKNFFKTLAIVYMLKLSMLTSCPVCRMCINFFTLPWWPGARKMFFTNGASLFNINMRTWNKGKLLVTVLMWAFRQ